MLYALVLLAGGLGALVAHLARDNVLIVQAGLGATLLYLIAKRVFHPRHPAPARAAAAVELPRDLKHLPLAFGVAVIIYWSGLQLYNVGTCLAQLCGAGR